MQAQTEDGKVYEDWDALVEGEANGYVVVAVIKAPTHKQPFPRVQGPYPTKVEAAKAKSRWRTKLLREQREHPQYADYLFRLHIEEVWKDPRER